MNRILSYILYLTLTLTTLSALSSCEDRFEYPGYEDIPEGVTTVNLKLSFPEYTPALESRSAGDAMRTIRTLWLAIYNTDGSFIEKIKIDNFTPGDTEQRPNTEEGHTGHAEFQFTYTNGRYHIYAIANHDLSDADITTEEALFNLPLTWNEDPSTGIDRNDQMFGWFRNDKDEPDYTGSPTDVIISPSNRELHAWVRRAASKVTIAFDPSALKEAVTVYIKNVTIHDIPKYCSLGENNTPSDQKELIADGESIDYSNNSDDYTNWAIKLQKGSGKKGSNHSNTANALFFFENMQGNYTDEEDYLKVQIPEETGTSIDDPVYNEDGSIKNDFKDRIKYGTYIEVVGYYVSKNSEKMSQGNIKYRFMLGKDIMYDYNAERNHHYKLTLKFRGFANEADWHISYVEPTPSLYTPDTYYVSYLYGQESSFPVRVVTGDNENSTAQYTLTAEILENEWWPYDEDTKSAPNTYIGNGDDKNGFAWMRSAVFSDVPTTHNANVSTPYYTGAYKSGNDVYDNRLYAGFLSLRKPETVAGKENVYKDIEFQGVTDTYQYGPNHSNALRNYYYEHNVGNAAYSLKVGSDKYVGSYENESNTFTEGPVTDGKYSVTEDNDGSVTLKIPLYTRPLKMVAASDFSGNNPFPSFMRRAVVRFKLWNQNGGKVWFNDLADNNKKVDYRDVPVYQVRRVENPKAIYRAHDNDAPFDVHLKHRRHRGNTVANQFEPFESDGPWRAIILVDPNNLVTLSKDGKVVSGVGNYVEGSTGTEIQFTYTPNGTCGANETRCAIIRVEYHDYTCNHLIFVRQGYDKGVKLAGTNWSLYQVYAAKINNSTVKITDYDPEDGADKTATVDVTRSPLSIGSFLKRGQYNWSIREAGNPGWLGTVTTSTKNSSGTITDYSDDKELSVAYFDGNSVAKRSGKWTDIQGYGWYNFTGDYARYENRWADTWNANISGVVKTLQVPTYKNFEDLRDQCDFGFGIAYADGATTTAETLDDAYGFIDEDNTGITDSKGVRACVAYDITTGANILFPLGKEGHGRRAAGGAYGYNTPKELGYIQGSGSKSIDSGTLTYGGLATVLWGSVHQHRPLTFNHYRTPGAIYWINQPKFVSGDKNASYASWDINYFTLTFNKYDASSIANFAKEGKKYTTDAEKRVVRASCSDALPIKLVYKNDTD